MKKDIAILAIGDLLIDREKPETIFTHVVDVLRSADITFANIEQMFTDKGKPSAVHATWSPPGNLPALNYIGLDVASLANNHTLDWGTEGLLDTMDRLEKAGIPTLGVGKNLKEAHKPLILEREGTKVAFLGYGCIGPDGYEAEENKPGYAPMRAWTLYKQHDYQPGTPPMILTFPRREDLKWMIEDVKNARAKADVVIVSFHWGIHFIPAVIPMYCFDVGYAAIDAGADLILGHHAHMLKGIEVYKGKVIFHSLGNFALELKSSAVTHFLNTVVKKLYGFEPDPNYPTVPFHPDFKYTMIAKIIISGGKITRVSYLPCLINTNAEPVIYERNTKEAQETFNYVERISRDQNLNVCYSWEGDEVVISG